MAGPLGCKHSIRLIVRVAADSIILSCRGVLERDDKQPGQPRATPVSRIGCNGDTANTDLLMSFETVQRVVEGVHEGGGSGIRAAIGSLSTCSR